MGKIVFILLIVIVFAIGIMLSGLIAALIIRNEIIEISKKANNLSVEYIKILYKHLGLELPNIY